METKILAYRTLIKKDGQYYHGFVPSLPGCHTQGKTIEETRKNLREAVTGCLKTLQKYGQPIPFEEGIESVETFDLSQIFPQNKKLCYV